MLLYGIGDVHGCLQELDAMLAFIDEDRGEEPAKIITIGDYVDRGPDSRGVIYRLDQRRREQGENVEHIYIKGNHEDMMLDGKGYHWMQNGGFATVDSYKGQLWYKDEVTMNFLKSLRMYYQYDHYVFVHAGIDPSKCMEEQNDQTMIWERIYNSYNDDYEYGYFVTHGHTPVQNIFVRKNQINIDTGCVFGGPLSAVRYNTERPDRTWFFQVEKTYDGLDVHRRKFML
jgi:serine/threonine protein phosphatase 1